MITPTTMRETIGGRLMMQKETTMWTTGVLAAWGWSGTKGERRWSTSCVLRDRDEASGFQQELNKVRERITLLINLFINLKCGLIRNDVGSALQSIHWHRASDESCWKSSRVNFLWDSSQESNLHHYFDPETASVVTWCKLTKKFLFSGDLQNCFLQEVQSVRNLLRRRGLSVQSVRKVCKNSAATTSVSIITLITLAISSVLSRKF